LNLESTRTIAATGRPEASGDASLIFIYGGPELGKRYELRGDSTIGRDASNEICIDLSFISRQHARFFRRDDRWFVKDLGSRNGTQVNGILVEAEQALDNGDQVKVGGAIFKYLEGGNVEALFHEEIYRMTIFDALTKVHNKRYLLEFLDREIARAARHGSQLWMAMLDIDRFKALNDTHGHQAGDYALERVASVVAALVRQEQLFARYGGEEFGLVLPELEEQQALAVCESVRRAVESAGYAFADRDLVVTVSIGLAKLQPEMTRDALIQAADAKLYDAKHNGRNRVEV
jgi:two-component system, cell cycle response regulator